MAKVKKTNAMRMLDKHKVDYKVYEYNASDEKIIMIPMKTLLPTTGYIHGGCSPIGMKKVIRRGEV